MRPRRCHRTWRAAGSAGHARESRIEVCSRCASVCWRTHQSTGPFAVSAQHGSGGARASLPGGPSVIGDLALFGMRGGRAPGPAGLLLPAPLDDGGDVLGVRCRASGDARAARSRAAALWRLYGPLPRRGRQRPLDGAASAPAVDAGRRRGPPRRRPAHPARTATAISARRSSSATASMTTGDLDRQGDGHECDHGCAEPAAASVAMGVCAIRNAHAGSPPPPAAGTGRWPAARRGSCGRAGERSASRAAGCGGVSCTGDRPGDAGGRV